MYPKSTSSVIPEVLWGLRLIAYLMLAHRVGSRSAELKQAWLCAHSIAYLMLTHRVSSRSAELE